LSLNSIAQRLAIAFLKEGEVIVTIRIQKHDDMST